MRVGRGLEGEIVRGEVLFCFVLFFFWGGGDK